MKIKETQNSPLNIAKVAVVSQEPMGKRQEKENLTNLSGRRKKQFRENYQNLKGVLSTNKAIKISQGSP